MGFPAEDKEHPSLTAEEDNADAAAVLSGFERPKGAADRRRLATLYDAVAGRVTKHHLVRNEPPPPPPPPQVIRHPTRGGPLGPDEVLFRRKDAPTRYAEHDVYNAHDRHLPRGGQGVLPDSDLLKSVHAYSSKFYGAMERRHRREMPIRPGRRGIDERSMDETALLAFGILLEEAGREILGRRGDCVFTEGLSEQDADGHTGDEVARHTGSAAGHQRAGSTSSRNERLPKRRRVTRSAEERP
ncbi:hypothetical protein C2857_002160 [Epichloe festucae Fl1]|uniref:Uncharacterized protein n=1 Tax=Epichloe festucae (strain Fl1) TaxID=877507 RepID=A0A7S9KUM8_EPIFF|nr:hypothetical protein C2857_002160 [Epichloe festucae Fl1]